MSARIASTWRTVAFFFLGVGEQKKILLLLVVGVLVDGFAISLAENLPFSMAVRDVLAWAFGNGQYQRDVTWRVFILQLAGGLLGYILLGLLLFIISRAGSRAIIAENDERTPSIKEIIDRLLREWQ